MRLACCHPWSAPHDNLQDLQRQLASPGWMRNHTCLTRAAVMQRPQTAERYSAQLAVPWLVLHEQQQCLSYGL